MIRPSELGDGLEGSYYEALPRAHKVAMAHCEMKKLLTLPGA